MWFSLFAVLLVLAVTFYQGLQGMFSAMINCIATVLAACLAFGLYENLYFDFLIDHQPDHGRAVALVGIFIVSSLVLRVVYDQLLTGNMQFPIYVDRAGGGVFGFITAMIIMGILTTGFQMLPFGPRFLGFQRIAILEGGQPVTMPEKDEENKGDADDGVVYRNAVKWNDIELQPHKLWLNPDGFTVQMVSYLSANALAGKNHFADLNPDFLEYIHHMRDGLFRESLACVGRDAVKVESYRYLRETELLYRLEETKGEGRKMLVQPVPSDRPLPDDRRRLMIRVTINESAENAEDPKNLHFTPAQIRLLGRQGDKGPVVQYPVIAVSDRVSPHLLVEVALVQDIQRDKEKGKTRLDLLFEVPADDFSPPWLLIYKQNGMTEIPVSKGLNEEGEPLTNDSSDDSDPDASDRDGRPSRNDDENWTGPDETTSAEGSRPGRVHGMNVANRDPEFTNDLPFELSSYTGNNAEVRNGKLLGGRITATLDSDWQPETGNDPVIRGFDVPDDVRLLQLHVAKLHPESWLGGILGGAKDRLRNIYLVDENNKEYRPVGAYAIAKAAGRPTCEIIYFDEIERDMARLPEFSRIKSRDLKKEYMYVLLFHVPPGTRAAELNTGNKRLSLDKYDLVAPL